MDDLQTQTAKKEARKAAIARRDSISIIDRIDRSALVCEQIGELLHDLLPNILSDEALSTPPVAIPTPNEPFMRPMHPYTAAMEDAAGDKPPVAAQAADASDAQAADAAGDEPLACHVGQEWIFEPRSTRPASEKPMLALYSSMRSEVDLSELAHGAFAHDWRVCFPAMIAEGGDVAPVEEPARMEFFEVSWAQLKALTKSFLSEQLRTYTIEQLEADGFAHVAPEQITAMIVPDGRFRCGQHALGLWRRQL